MLVLAHRRDRLLEENERITRNDLAVCVALRVVIGRCAPRRMTPFPFSASLNEDRMHLVVVSVLGHRFLLKQI